MRCIGRFQAGVLVALICTGLLLMGCRTPPPAPRAAPRPQDFPKRILVLPFSNLAEVYGEESLVRSPLSGKIFRTGEVPVSVPDLLTEKLISLLEKRGNTYIFPPHQAEDLRSGLLGLSSETPSDREIAVRIGKRLQVDGVMTGYVYRFVERIGNRYSAERPASVAMDVHLIRIPTGRVIWSGHLDETQKSLSENILQFNEFLKHKGRWVTAEEMAISGLSGLLESFPSP